jgi:hypothetical protein
MSAEASALVWRRVSAAARALADNAARERKTAALAVAEDRLGKGEYIARAEALTYAAKEIESFRDLDAVADLPIAALEGWARGTTTRLLRNLREGIDNRDLLRVRGVAIALDVVERALDGDA